MIVQCENCETRFHVADARIPEKGARVRCSRCHHRFHITPSSGTSAGPSPEGDVSARPQPRGGEPKEDDELDNPEFLFDAQSGEQSAPPSRPTPRAARPATAESKARREPPPPEPEPADAVADEPHVPEPPPPPAPLPALEERVVSTTGKTAQEMLDAGAPNLGPRTGSVEFAPALEDRGLDSDSDDTRSRFFLGEDSTPAKPEPPPSLRPAKDKRAKTPAPVPELDAAFAGSLGDDSDEEAGDAGWDSLTRSAEPANVFEAGASFGLVTEPTSPAAPSGGAPVTLFDQSEPAEADAKKKHGSKVKSFDPEAVGSAGTIARIAACLVGVALLGGAARGLYMQREARAASEDAQQAAGWTASDIETFVARDSLGERVLVVRGNLYPEGAAAPPEVEVTLLETDGERVGEPRRAWLERLDDAEIAPDSLTVRLAADAGEISGIGPQVTGFTALLPDPPARARRVRVTLSAGKQPMRGTATAGPPAPAPATAPAGAPQLAAPKAAPSNALPSNAAPVPPAAVVPAAPEPE